MLSFKFKFKFKLRSPRSISWGSQFIEDIGCCAESYLCSDSDLLRQVLQNGLFCALWTLATLTLRLSTIAVASRWPR